MASSSEESAAAFRIAAELTHHRHVVTVGLPSLFCPNGKLSSKRYDDLTVVQSKDDLPSPGFNPRGRG